MNFLKLKKIGKFPLFISVTGIIVPHLTIFAVGIFLNIEMEELIRVWVIDTGFFSRIFMSFFYFLEATLINVLPYLILSILAVETLGKLNIKKRRSKEYGIISSYLLILVFQIFINIIYWLDIFSDNPSSTGGLIFLSYLSGSLFLGGIGYVIGWSLGNLVKKIRGEK